MTATASSIRAARPPPRPIPARRLASIEGSRILLVDNGKLDPVYGPYAALWDVVRGRWPGAVWSAFSDDLLRHDDRTVEEIGKRLVAEFQPEAAILALADVGVSLGTTLLALTFERLGVPTAILATPVGARCIRGVFDAMLPGLELVALETVRTDSRERVVQLAGEALPSIEACLTASPAPRATAAPAFEPPGSGAVVWSDAANAVHAFQDWAESRGLGDGLPLGRRPQPPSMHCSQPPARIRKASSLVRRSSRGACCACAMPRRMRP